MKLILITSPTYFVEEDKIITALFEEGLDILHLCKTDTAPIYAERLLTLIPEQFHAARRLQAGLLIEFDDTNIVLRPKRTATIINGCNIAEEPCISIME